MSSPAPLSSPASPVLPSLHNFYTKYEEIRPKILELVAVLIAAHDLYGKTLGIVSFADNQMISINNRWFSSNSHRERERDSVQDGPKIISGVFKSAMSEAVVKAASTANNGRSATGSRRTLIGRLASFALTLLRVWAWIYILKRNTRLGDLIDMFSNVFSLLFAALRSTLASGRGTTGGDMDDFPLLPGAFKQ